MQHALLELDPRVGHGGGGATQALWRECERLLVQEAQGWSLDRIIAVRDFFWFGNNPGTDPSARGPRPLKMREYLRHLAHSHLEARSGSTEVVRANDSSAVDAITHYRWLTFAIPEDLLLAAVDVDPPPTRVDIEPPLLVQRLMDVGVAEIHQHVSGGMDFPIMWASVLAALADPCLPAHALDSPSLPFRSGVRELRWMLACAIARCVLCEFLALGHRPGGEVAPLHRFLHRYDGAPAWTPSRRRVLARALTALGWAREADLPSYKDLRELYGDLHPEGLRIASSPPDSMAEVWRTCDPIACRLSLSGPNAGERWLVHQGLSYLELLERSAAGDDLFRRLFWQVLRVRCIYYRTIVQRPMTAGLQWFIRFFGRLGLLRNPLRRVRPEVSYRVAGGNQAIAALEVRTSSGDTPVEVAEELQSLIRSWRHVLDEAGRHVTGLGEPEFGVVVHLIKNRDPERYWSHGSPPAFGWRTYAQPRGAEPPPGRYLHYFAGQAASARALAQLLRAVPRSLWLVRGLDVANDELSVPTWALVPLYRFVQREAALAAQTPASGGAPPLRLTAHVGEDFRHLQEGLRRIFECIQYLLDRTGGRLGHATALGVEPRAWAESVGSVLMPAEERLWDLVFEWRLYTGFRIPPELRAVAPAGRPERVENELRALVEEIFRPKGFTQRDFTPHHLAEAHHVLHQLLTPPLSWRSPDGSFDAFNRALETLDLGKIRAPEQVLKLLKDHRERMDVFQRGQRLVDITLDESEVAALYATQDALRREVGQRGIVVEVNPSSNLLIGDLLDLRNHPILRLFPPEHRADGPPPVHIAVGSDDPITFSTHLVREYSLLHEAALTAGYPDRVVHEWLAAIRQTSLDARFTVAWRPGAYDMACALEEAFDDFLQQPRAKRRRTGHHATVGAGRGGWHSP
ncbi:hypothetical protein [Corallococcus sp. AB011P]|uniref:hypothetical protein n=1 Tax=Corallococcus sp. AB011P TaxID=2316735 RepID=UPI0013158058|nr:hypothetical protein [Corallococcus sp. AB011P]